MKPQIYPNQWLSVPQPVRYRISQIFNLPKSTGTMIEDQRVISDGHTVEDLMYLSVARMQEYLGSDKTDLYALFQEVVDKVALELVPAPVVVEEKKNIQINIEVDGNEVKVTNNKETNETQTHGKTKKGGKN